MFLCLCCTVCLSCVFLLFVVIHFWSWSWVKHGPGNTPPKNVWQIYKRIVQKMVQKFGLKIVWKYSEKCSPDCEGEFVDVFPTDRSSVFDGFWAVLRHFFSMSQKKCLTSYFCVTFRAGRPPPASHPGGSVPDKNMCVGGVHQHEKNKMIPAWP